MKEEIITLTVSMLLIILLIIIASTEFFAIVGVFIITLMGIDILLTIVECIINITINIVKEVKVWKNKRKSRLTENKRKR